MDESKAFRLLPHPRSSVSGFISNDSSDMIQFFPAYNTEENTVRTTLNFLLTEVCFGLNAGLIRGTVKMVLILTKLGPDAESVVATRTLTGNVSVVPGDEPLLWIMDAKTGEFITDLGLDNPENQLNPPISDELKDSISKAIPQLTQITEQLEQSIKESIDGPKLVKRSENGMISVGYYDDEGEYYQIGAISSFVDCDTFAKFISCCELQLSRVV